MWVDESNSPHGKQVFFSKFLDPTDPTDHEGIGNHFETTQKNITGNSDNMDNEWFIVVFSGMMDE